MTSAVLRRRSAAFLTSAVCAIALLPATAAHAGDDTGGTTFRVNLTPAEVPGGGDPNGSGLAVIRVNPANDEVCWDVNWSGLEGEVTAMHLHHGARGAMGPHGVDLLDNASLPGKEGAIDSCTTVEHEDAAEKDAGGGHSGDLAVSTGRGMFGAHEVENGVLEKIIANPQEYYLNVHSTSHKMGAIRGQLG